MEGYIKIHRKVQESAIWNKPPMYYKVWNYLLMNAQHAEYKDLKKGQLITSIDEIREACSYYIGYRKVTPSRKEIFGVLNWLRNPDEGNDEGNDESPMIVTTKVTHGLLVNVVNYCLYQDRDTHEGNNEGNGKVTTKVTTKVGVREQYKQECNKNDKNVNTKTHGDCDAFFEQVWRLYPRKRGKGQVSDKTKRKLFDIGLDQMTRCIDRYKAEKAGKDEQYIMHGSTFFNSGYVDYLDENYEKADIPEGREIYFGSEY